jgi:hypothetical protein
LNTTWSPLDVATGLGTYEPFPFVPTIDTVTTEGVLVPGVVVVPLELFPPPQRDEATDAARSEIRIHDDRMMLVLQK